MPPISDQFNATPTLHNHKKADISESRIRQEMPEILDILLTCHSTSTAKQHRNIIWANDHYLQHGNFYTPTAEITPDLITGEFEQLIMPRALKTAEMQKARTKSSAEVFTPLHIVKMQNDILENSFRKSKLEPYLKRKWLEIACGEGPYMASRYAPETGEIILLENRVGFIDRKLRRISQFADTTEQWHAYAVMAFQSAYGFEWHGDSLLLARENLLYTYADFYIEKWQTEPPYEWFKEIAEIISYNLFQMDGLTYTVPLSIQTKTEITQWDLFNKKGTTIARGGKGKPAKIKNWRTGKMQYFSTAMK